MIVTATSVSVMVCLTVLTILNQFGPSRWNIVRGKDHLNLIPIWTFFAPNPGQTDYHLMYRFQNSTGQMSAWIEIPLAEQRTARSWIWNPEKRSKKVLADIVASFIDAGAMQCEHDTDYLLTLPYLLLLRVVCTHAGTHHSVDEVVQFVLAETKGFARSEAPHLLMVSRFHALTRQNSKTPRSLPLHV